MKHPVAGMEQAAAFMGNEVEGKVCLGMRTVILRREVSQAEWDAVLTHDPKHVFLTEQFESWRWLEQTVLPWARQHGVCVTAGRTDAQMDAFFRLPVSADLRVMVRFWNCPWHTMLRPGDEVSVGTIYDMVTMPVGQGHRTKPQDYAGDKAVPA
jgi:hypothetical protein